MLASNAFRAKLNPCLRTVWPDPLGSDIQYDCNAGRTVAITGMKVRRLIANVTICSAVALGQTEAQTREVSGIVIPEAVSAAGRNLSLNGFGVRRENVFFKTYVIALYLQEIRADARLVIQGDKAKQIVITMLRGVNREKFIEAMEAGNSKFAVPTLRARLDLLEQSVPDLTKGEVIAVTWVPDTGTIVNCQGREITIPGKDFADAIFAVWLGANPVDAALKCELLGNESTGKNGHFVWSLDGPVAEPDRRRRYQ